MLKIIGNVLQLYSSKSHYRTHTAVTVLLLNLLIVLPTATADVPRCVCTTDCDYISIQDAIDAAVDHQVIEVCDGVYRENINFLGKAITVRSINGSENTTIQNPASSTSSRIMYNSGEGLDSVLHGFTISGRGAASTWLGGGVSIIDSSPTLMGNIIEYNEALDAGVVSTVKTQKQR